MAHILNHSEFDSLHITTDDGTRGWSVTFFFDLPLYCSVVEEGWRVNVKALHYGYLCPSVFLINE